ncbi:hypothetical protein KSP40_PGU018725 [Platanthera guangdongensis]|uniref:PB1 domain-containing protein n=1 Tax=Platanthera guangdongensis TaxID=2320717 RepID=A0ABR2MJ95_9ASPA
MEDDCVGRTLDFSTSDSYELLYDKIAVMFGLEKSELCCRRILYQHEDDTIKRTKDEPFEEFIKKTSKKLLIRMDTSFKDVPETLVLLILPNK